MDKKLVKLIASTRKLPEYTLLSSLTADQVSHALNVWSKLSRAENLEGAFANRKERGIPYEFKDDLSQSYMQCELQTLCKGHDATVRENYRSARDAATVEAIENRVGPVCRTRITSLVPGATLPRHIDDPRQRRVIVLLKGKDRFSIVKSGKSFVVPMSVGELWFINTAFEHDVVNIGKEPRIALIADIVDAKALDEKLISMQKLN